MKLVEHRVADTTSHDIEEVDLYEMMSDTQWMRVSTKADYELLRLKHKTTNALRIVYQDNKKLRSRNEWMEKRVISLLLREFQYEKITHNVKMEYKGVETEIDGLTLDNTMIEMKFTKISDDTLEFLKRKSEKLGFDRLIIVGKDFPSSIPSGILALKFIPDRQSLREYYQDTFELPDLIEDLLARRHVRYLLDNGTWTSQKRRYTRSAKWKAIEKMRADIANLFRFTQPIKIYWSLSEMLGPLDEFRGNGYPIHRYLSAFDIDGEHQGYHQYTSQSPFLCEKCRVAAKKKLDQFEIILKTQGNRFSVFESGSKGYHVYLLEDSGSIEVVDKTTMEKSTQSFYPYIDAFLSKYGNDFDEHRIFKVPYTVDASTGFVVSPESIRIEFEDRLIKV